MTKRDEAQKLWERWAAMWNGDYSQASDIIVVKGFNAHLTDIGLLLADPVKLRMNSPQEVHEWVARIRERYASLNYTTKTGPFIDIENTKIIASWQAEGVFGGKTSMPNDIPGKSFTVVGTDILGFKDGKLYEYWAINSPGPWHD
jgi:hypothetical protein